MKHFTLTHRAAALLTAVTIAGAVTAGPAEAGPTPPPTTVTPVMVHANSAGANGQWLNTGLDFVSQHIVGWVSASGTSTVSASSPTIGPNGLAGPDCAAYATVTDPCVDGTAPLGALLGRFGPTGTPFVIGTSHVLGGSGDLELAYNDLVGAFADNTGGYVATVDQTDITVTP